MGEIKEWTKLITQLCVNCNHVGGAHMKNPFDNPQGRLRVSFKSVFIKCNTCEREDKEKICRHFEPTK